MARIPSTVSVSNTDGALVRINVPVGSIVPDSKNRPVVEDSEFDGLCDSIRLFGLLLAVHVWRQADGRYQLIDGERRWRAANKVNLVEIPCDVWPADAERRRVTVAGLAMNEHRKAHGSLHVARRLREIKNESGLSHAELAEQTGLPLDRVKSYFSLFAASDELLSFLEQQEVPLKAAIELVRYERATNEARARRLTERYKESPLTAQEIIALRKREHRPPSTSARESTQPARPARAVGLLARFEVEVRKEPSHMTHLEELVQRLGYRLVAVGAQVAA